jgi:hypothetical protein
MSPFARSALCVVFVFAFALQASASDDSYWKKDPKDWKVELYPVLVWAPFLGAKATLPEFPNLPNHPDVPGEVHPGGNISSSFNGAAFFGFRVEKSKWEVDTSALWAGLSAQRTTNPQFKVKTDVIYGQGMVGREVLPDL